MLYISPKYHGSPFTCPHCRIAAKQRWTFLTWTGSQVNVDDADLGLGRCDHCAKSTLWVEGAMIHPEGIGAPPPNPDLPKPISQFYLEAASIATKSPRGAAALLRLAVQLLCKELGEKGKNIDEDIAGLVKKGLPEPVQQSLDCVRVIGNHAVHPGQIDTDDPQVVGHLFSLINLIAEYMISMPNKVSNLYSNLPKSALDAIQRRDK